MTRGDTLVYHRPMSLSEYLKKEGLTQAEFALKTGLSRNAINRYAQGTRFPSKKVLLIITEFTKGKVTANDFMS